MPPPPLSIVPLTRSWFRGLANVRGALYGVVDLAQFHGEAAITPSGRARLLLIGARLGIHCALLVSHSLGLRSADDFEVDVGEEDRPWVAQRLRDAQGQLWLQVDVTKLLASPQFLDAGLE